MDRSRSAPAARRLDHLAVARIPAGGFDMNTRRIWIAASSLLATFGCVSNDEFQRVSDERNSLSRRLDDESALNEENARTIEEINAEKARLAAERDRLRSANESASARMAELQQQISDMQGKMIPGVTTFQEDGVFTYRVEGALLFDSGKAELKPGGQKTLKDIAELLKGNDFQIEVAGHTDTDPTSVTKKQFPTNRHLGAARALAVCAALEKDGVVGDRLFASSYGEFRPVDPTDKAKNRRVEIRVLLRDAVPAGG
jgi:chemotaxis protein MotB